VPNFRKLIGDYFSESFLKSFKTWSISIGLIVVAVIVTVGYLATRKALNDWSIEIRDAAIAECNEAQLERDLVVEREQRALVERDLKEAQQALIDAPVIIKERTVFRDRVVKEARETQDDLIATDPTMACKTEVTDVTHNALKALSARSREIQE